MQTYHITWEIEVDATSPEAAAEQALNIQRDHGSMATVFTVVNEKGESKLIDLEKIHQVRAAITKANQSPISQTVKLYDRHWIF